MQKPLDHTMSPDDRAAIVSSFRAILAFFAALAVAFVLILFAGTHAQDDTRAQASRGGQDVAMSMPF